MTQLCEYNPPLPGSSLHPVFLGGTGPGFRQSCRSSSAGHIAKATPTRAPTARVNATPPASVAPREARLARLILTDLLN